MNYEKLPDEWGNPVLPDDEDTVRAWDMENVQTVRILNSQRHYALLRKRYHENLRRNLLPRRYKRYSWWARLLLRLRLR